MANSTYLGTPARTHWLQHEAHKLTVEAEAAVALKKSTPVKLTTDGKYTPWAKTDGLHTLVGYVYADCAQGDLNTAWVRGYCLIYAVSAAAMNAGPVTYEGLVTAADDENLNFPIFDDGADATNYSGWSLDDAEGAGEIIRVLLAN